LQQGMNFLGFFQAIAESNEKISDDVQKQMFSYDRDISN